MHLFGKAKVKPSPKESIVNLRETLQMLEKRQIFLESKVEAELKVAKLNATKNKRAALMALKKKKQLENQIDKISGARMTIETQVMAIESANVNYETMNAMRQAAEAMKQLHGNMDINKVDETMDEIRDQMEIANEISEAISRPVAFGQEIDEDELLSELEELEKQELDAKILETPVPVRSTPEVPTYLPTRPTAIEDEEDAALAELQASMAM